MKEEATKDDLMIIITIFKWQKAPSSLIRLLVNYISLGDFYKRHNHHFFVNIITAPLNTRNGQWRGTGSLIPSEWNLQSKRKSTFRWFDVWVTKWVEFLRLTPSPHLFWSTVTTVSTSTVSSLVQNYPILRFSSATLSWRNWMERHCFSNLVIMHLGL